jgi:hypothetical protein
MALEQRDIDRQAQVVYIRRALRNGRLKSTKTEGSSVRCRCRRSRWRRSISSGPMGRVSFSSPSPRGGYFDLHNFRNRA